MQNVLIMAQKIKLTMMVDGPDSIEIHMHPEGSDEMNSGIVIQKDEDTPQQITSPTTTISTIAVQSGETRVVIALLQVRNMRCILIIIYIFLLLRSCCSFNASNNFNELYLEIKKKFYLEVFLKTKHFNMWIV